MKMALKFAAIALLLGASWVGCGTAPDRSPSEAILPNAAAGPFRSLRIDEVGNLRSAPNVLDDKNLLARDPAVLDADGDPSSEAVVGYFAGVVLPEGEEPSETTPTNALLRYLAEDGRSFGRSPDVVYSAVEPWEGGKIGAPAVIEHDGKVKLYYHAEGGIGLLEGDGTSFEAHAEPVLTAPSSGWDAGLTPQSPGVLLLPDGSLRMFYEACDGAACAIGEATSVDGLTWSRLAQALAPRADLEDAYDSSTVRAPFAVLATSPTGRLTTRLYYEARTLEGAQTIALAARFGLDGAFERALSPVHGSGAELAPTEPAVLQREGFSLLFVTQNADRNDERRVAAAAVAPATAVLSPPFNP